MRMTKAEKIAFGYTTATTAQVKAAKRTVRAMRAPVPARRATRTATTFTAAQIRAAVAMLEDGATFREISLEALGRDDHGCAAHRLLNARKVGK